MKRFVLFFFYVTCHFIGLNAATVTWTGAAGDNNWFTQANWSTGTRPGTNDDVVFNISALAYMDDVFNSMNTRTINSLTITGGATVEIRYTPNPGFSKTLQVKSTSTSTLGLRIDAGSVLLFHGINLGGGTLLFTLDLCGAMGVTGEISGELQLSGAGSTDTRDSTRLRVINGASYGNLVVKSGGVIKYLDLSGNTISAAGSYLTMENGSTYEIAKSYGYFPQATWQSGSFCKASSPGATVPGFVDGVTYGNLEWNCPAQSDNEIDVNVTFNDVHLISTGSGPYFRITGAAGGNHVMTINGDLNIESGCYIDIVGALASSTSSGKIILKGDLNNSGLINTNGVYGTINQLELAGTSNQNITCGFIQGVRLELIMNGDSATLLSALFLPSDSSATGDNLQLIKGKIITDTVNILTLKHTATVSGGSELSFVSGPMIKRGTDDFTFPVGKGSIYAPIKMTSLAGESSSDAFRAEYVRANPQSIYGPNVDPASRLNHVSFVEYWKLQRLTSGAAIYKRVSLAVNVTSFCTNLDSTFVGQWNGTVWTNEESTVVYGTPVGPNQTGTITSRHNIAGFTSTTGVFTLATSLPFASNPLPLKLVTFDAEKNSTSKAFINWELASVCSPAAKFEIQRASSDKHFTSVAVVNGSTTDRFYIAVDNGLKNGINYYRLKMIDESGTISYSRTVVVMNGTNGVILTSLIPTFVNSSAQLTIASSNRQQLDLIITDMQGRVVQKQNHSVMAGNTTIQLKTDHLSAGVYQLIGITAEGKTNVIRFVKQ